MRDYINNNPTGILLFAAFVLVLGCYMTLRLIGIEDGVTGELITALGGGILVTVQFKRSSGTTEKTD